jgi:hypothetical protein
MTTNTLPRPFLAGLAIVALAAAGCGSSGSSSKPSAPPKQAAQSTPAQAATSTPASTTPAPSGGSSGGSSGTAFVDRCAAQANGDATKMLKCLALYPGQVPEGAMTDCIGNMSAQQQAIDCLVKAIKQGH